MNFFEKRAYMKEGKCFNCGEKGHMNTACSKPKKPWADQPKVFRHR